VDEIPLLLSKLSYTIALKVLLQSGVIQHPLMKYDGVT
jgi:hypothetical protein